MIMFNKELLKRQLQYAEREEKLNKEIDSAKCPICGSNLKMRFHQGGGDSIVIPFWAEIKCKSCGMFSKKIERNSYESYHWNYDGSDEIALKEEVWHSVMNYCKR